tara:strand:- start:1314 stop:1727 length:414 start_codon:yes stop_codon:yes gene_type:complete
MPKAKPDRVEVIRIELQESERQILRDYVSVNTIGEVAQLAEGIDKLLTFENLYIGATIFEIITGREILIGTPNDLDDLLGQLKDGLSPIANTLDSIPGVDISQGFIPGTPIPTSVIGAILGGLANLGNAVDDANPLT